MFKRLFVALGALALTTAIAAAAPGGMQLPPQPKIRPVGMPAGYVMVSPCIPQMGEHWANPKNLQAPIYGTYKGEVIFSEIMVPKSVLDKGFNYPSLSALPGYTANHLSIDFEPHGHPGMPFPHYDFHLYYVSPAAVARICPKG